MRTAVSAKRCPECGKMAVLQAENCTGCGHQFRTQFDAPANRTQAFDAVMLPRLPVLPVQPVRRAQPLKTFSAAFSVSFVLVIVVGIAAWFFWGTAPTVLSPVVPPAVYASTRVPLRAEDLYERITISMSLYDLDQAAGSTGRIIHTSHPHSLILSYDFPGQSVRVSLSRTDPTINDYRVQAVALYRGSTLLQHHADDDE
jgi:hypothetical protein